MTWFSDVRTEGWATCPLTEVGFVRVSSNVKVIPDARPPAQVMALLERMREVDRHTFWADDVSPVDRDAIAFERVVGYRQVTDAHLLSLAIRRGGRMATFDRGVPELLPDDPDRVELIG